MKKVLVTGATGFIGNYVVSALLDKGCEVIASSRDLEKAMQNNWFSKVTYVPFDLSTYDEDKNYYDFFLRPDTIIHLAWEGLPNYKSVFHEEENLPRHYRFLERLVREGACDITITGTCFEYGMAEGQLSEDMPVSPTNSYAKAKDRLRKKMEKLQGHHSFHFKWVRLFYMYGKGQNPKSLFSQLDNAIAGGDPFFNMSGGEQVRDFLPIEKVAEYIVQIALQNHIEGVINCCSGIPVTVKSLVENYLKEKHASIELNLGFYPYPDYEPMRFWGDNTKLKQILKNDGSN